LGSYKKLTLSPPTYDVGILPPVGDVRRFIIFFLGFQWTFYENPLALISKEIRFSRSNAKGIKYALGADPKGGGDLHGSLPPKEPKRFEV
jgi:hypothetical protein